MIFDKGLKQILIIFVSIKILAFILASFEIIPFGRGLHEGNYIYEAPSGDVPAKFAPYDGQWYLDITETGYSKEPRLDYQANYQFFPLYPLMILTFKPIFGSAYIAGIFVSILAHLIATVFLYWLSRQLYGSEIAGRAVIYMLVFPTAVFFSAIYSESLFLMLVVLCFYLCYRNRWLLAGFFGFLAALTRGPGIFLFFPIAYIYLTNVYLKDRKIDYRIIGMLLIPLGTLLFMFYNYCLLGDFFAYIHIQKAWYHKLTFPLLTPFRHLPLTLFGYRNSLNDFIFCISAFFALVFLFSRVKREFFIYALIFTLLPLTVKGTTMSFTRYLLVLFPFFLFLAMIAGRRAVHYGIVSVLLSLYVVYTIRFTSWYWIG